MRPKTSVAHRVAKHTGIPAEDIQWTLDNVTKLDPLEECWSWTGALVKNSPVMFDSGKTRPVRHVLLAACPGITLPPKFRVEQMCPRPFCVNPAHSAVRQVYGVCEAEPAPIMSAEEFNAQPDPIEDVVDTVYSRDPPWDPAVLAAEFDYSIEQFEEAIRLIETGAF